MLRSITKKELRALKTRVSLLPDYKTDFDLSIKQLGYLFGLDPDGAKYFTQGMNRTNIVFGEQEVFFNKDTVDFGSLTKTIEILLGESHSDLSNFIFNVFDLDRDRVLQKNELLALCRSSMWISSTSIAVQYSLQMSQILVVDLDNNQKRISRTNFFSCSKIYYGRSRTTSVC
ncbi:calcium binding protein [Anaeramoeba flamelloides]|uniref:Calcium binding protein n=1 Tax=Anaeramoeba flamelloides TaxID=1746091 RepID=A0AAV7Z7K3_9EUKA|nr:calcium binding protein [Anaeramoeba flamelloides]